MFSSIVCVSQRFEVFEAIGLQVLTNQRLKDAEYVFRHLTMTASPSIFNALPKLAPFHFSGLFFFNCLMPFLSKSRLVLALLCFLRTSCENFTQLKDVLYLLFVVSGIFSKILCFSSCFSVPSVLSPRLSLRCHPGVNSWGGVTGN